jgi:hypothetical protein
VYVCFGLECMCDIRLESLYVERSVSLALYIVITLIYIIKYITLQTKSDKRVWGARTPREGRGLRD